MTIMMPGLNNNKVFEIAPYGRFSVWISKDNSICFQCNTCTAYANLAPSKYCPECGALMLNAEDAKNEYNRQLSEIRQGASGEGTDSGVEHDD